MASKGDEKKKSKQKAVKGTAKKLLNNALVDLPYVVIGTVALGLTSYSMATIPTLLGSLIDSANFVPLAQASPSACPVPSSTEMKPFKKATFLFLMGGASSFIRTYTLGLVESRMVERLKSEVFDSIIDSDCLASSTSSSTDNADEEADDETIPLYILETLTPTSLIVVRSSLMNSIRYLSSTFNGFYRLYKISPVLTMYTGLLTPLFAVSVGILYKMKSKYTKRLDAKHALDNARTAEVLSSLKLITLSGTREFESQANKKRLAEEVALSRSVTISEGIIMGSITTGIGLLLGVVFFQGGRLMRDKKLTAGELTSFTGYTALLGMGVRGLGSSRSAYQDGLFKASKVFTFIEEKKNPVSEVERQGMAYSQGGVKDIMLHCGNGSGGEIVLDNVTFAYPNSSTPILEAKSLKLASGSVTLLVGPNGSGKSTLANLLIKLLHPTTGTVKFDGMDVRDISVGSIRKYVKVLSQDVGLFDVNGRDNIVYGNTDVSDGDVAAICSALDIDLSSAVYSDSVGLNGCRLSGGQRQRLCLARALVSSSSKFVVLDEPTTFLDMDGKELIAKAIKVCKGRGVTVLVISHESKGGEGDGGVDLTVDITKL